MKRMAAEFAAAFGRSQGRGVSCSRVPYLASLWMLLDSARERAAE
jgi:hypothetical protein